MIIILLLLLLFITILKLHFMIMIIMIIIVIITPLACACVPTGFPIFGCCFCIFFAEVPPCFSSLCFFAHLQAGPAFLSLFPLSLIPLMPLFSFKIYQKTFQSYPVSRVSPYITNIKGRLCPRLIQSSFKVSYLLLHLISFAAHGAVASVVYL